MRNDNLARVLRLGTEPGAVVDERPAEVLHVSVWRERLRGFVLGLVLGLAVAALAFLWARSEFAQMREDLRRPVDLKQTR